MRSTRAALAGCVSTVLAALAACGSGDNGEASKTPDQILTDVRASVAQLHSFHFAATITETSGPTSAEGEVGLPGRMHITLRQSGGVAEVIFTGGKSYLKANRQFWDRNGSAQAGALLADRWVIVPNSAGGLNGLTDITDPAKIGDCIAGTRHGTLTKQGTESVGGQQAVVIVDAGQVPGDAPGRLWVATSGAALPLRAQQTGPQMPGGSPHACNSETSSPNQLRSDLTYSAFNASVTIAAPSGALDLSTIAG